MNIKILIADIVIYGSAIGIILWAILKSIGVIHSPVWIEMLPYILGGSSILGVSYKLGQFSKDFEHVKSKVNIIDKRLEKVEDSFIKVENEHNLCMQGKLAIHS